MAITPGMAAGGKAAPTAGGMTREERKVIFASSLGTVFEWYDFYLYGSLAAIIGAQFFSGARPDDRAYIFALLAFAAGFLVRPFGALVFGRLGDLVGRKYTFLVTILIMGLSTFIVGLLPSYATDRHRGADHPDRAAPAAGPGARRRVRRRGDLRRRARAARASAASTRRWIQTTATLGLFLSLLVILGTRTAHGRGRLRRLGLAHSVPGLGRCCSASRSGSGCSCNESPAFQQDEGRRHDLEGAADRGVRPMGERQDRASSRCSALTAGQAVVWYTGQFYALFFLTQIAEGRRLPPPTS